MNGFTLELTDSLQTQKFTGITQFIGADASGSFGIRAGHAPLIAVLRYGLVRFQDASGTWHYAALPGGVLRFTDRLTVTGVHYFLGTDRDTLVAQLAHAMETEDSDVHNARATLAQIEQSLMRRLAELGKGDGWVS
jgi:F-type H+-transporting ATPase subunit epsilon